MPATPSAVRYRVSRLVIGEVAAAQKVCSTMAEVFEEKHDPLSLDYVERLLARDEFWLLAASLGGEVVGGLTAHALPMTRTQGRELFIYDIAVRADHQRQGVGRLLMAELARLAGQAGIDCWFVPADDEDAHALDFYRSLGGVASPVTFFTFDAKAAGAERSDN